ncbi:Hypothetical predicted protein [Paramuricea clavata]|uniref:Uncharacterized protein n=1 Tax=Paramuricea clavata TaxID=317549 RepID=A0A7D9EJ64_PARCT|nr:Hypothetical predicted protein [Paramuricea clavata]
MFLQDYLEPRYFSPLTPRVDFGKFLSTIDEESLFLTYFNTPFGRYRFQRLPFSIKSAPEVDQRVMEELFDDIEGCEPKLNKKKCKIRVREVSYIGHTLTSEGIKPDKEKVKAILLMPEPSTKQELQWFIGMVQKVAKFIPYLSEKLAPLRSLLKKNAAWQWNAEHQRAYELLKKDCSKQPTYCFSTTCRNHEAYQEIGADDSLEESLEIHMVLPISAPKLKELQDETGKDPVMHK